MTMICSKSKIKEFVSMRKEAIAAVINKEIKLAIIQVGDSEASNRYVRNKMKDCEEVGITSHLFSFPVDVTQAELTSELQKLVPEHHGIIIQLPLPEHLNKQALQDLIPAEKDVDGFRADSMFKPCTPLGIMHYLEYAGFRFDGANVLVIGRSDLVGKPMAKMLLDANATVTVCHSHTKNIHRFIQSADLIICAVGKANFLNCYSIHCPVIDVGINFNEEGKMVGDCFNTEWRDVSPVPGGVGLLTRYALLNNMIKAGEINE